MITFLLLSLLLNKVSECDYLCDYFVKGNIVFVLAFLFGQATVGKIDR